MEYYHKELAAGRWQTLTLSEQMGNIGSEVYRSINWFRKKIRKSSRVHLREHWSCSTLHSLTRDGQADGKKLPEAGKFSVRC